MQAALEAARRAGWWYRKATAHTGSANVFCRRGHDDHCRFEIFGTGRAPAGPARSLQRMIKNCTHVAEEDRPKLDQARNLIEGANRIVSAAEAMLHRARRQNQIDEALAEAAHLESDRVEEMLEVAERNVVQVNELLAAAIEWEREANVAGAEAAELLTSEGLASAGPSDSVDAAEDVLQQANAVLDEVHRRTAEAAELRGAVDALRGRIRLVRASLSTRPTG